MGLSRKALAVVAGPYRFYQVLWLYTQFPDLEWSILLLPYGKGDEIRKDLREKCEKLKIFANIYDSHMIGQDSGTYRQMMMLMKMFWFYLIGKKKTFMKRIIRSQTSGQEFDVFFVGCEYSIIEGAIIGLADEKEVYIFEEGLSDYVRRKKYPSFNMKEIMSFIVTRMGYFSPYQCFEMENEKYCIKYASLPRLLQQRSYKDIRFLFRERNSKFNELIKRLYNFDIDMLRGCDVILFTVALEDELKKKNKNYVDMVHQWIVNRYYGKKIFIKKHPRDDEEYSWTDVDCVICEKNIPAEVVIGFMENQDVLMMEISTSIINILNKKNITTIFRLKETDEKYENEINYVQRLLNIPADDVIYI